MNISSTKIQAFQQKILGRYADNKRDLPRRDTDNPYWVLVSEVMLQQTQVDRVVPKFLAFLQTLPTVVDLAETDKHTLLSLWSGLGFNSRAVRLQQAAQMIVEKFGSKVPSDRESLQSLPGIGPYCSASIMAFAFNLPAPVVDTNVRRVLISELGLAEDISAGDLEEVALNCVPQGRSNDRHNALMDYGSLVATAAKTGVKPLGKQSKFEGSRRQLRGRLLKYLLQHKETDMNSVRTLSERKDYADIVQEMVDEGLVKIDGDRIFLV